MDSLTDIAVFVQVVDSGSFTAAAEKLSLSKSIVSRYVSRLEDRLGARLLNRTTRRLSLTEAGQVFYTRSEKGLQELMDAELEVSRLQGEPRGTLRINAPMSFGILHIAPAIPDFLKPYPSLKIDMRLDDRSIDVIEEGFDVTIRISELTESSLIARRLAPCRHVLVASPNYLKRRGEPRIPQDLRNHSILANQWQGAAQAWEFRMGDDNPTVVNVSAAIQMNNSLALREALLADGGIARVPTFVVGRDVQEGRLQSVLRHYQLPEVSIYAVFPQRQYLTPKVRAFVEFMVEHISMVPYWDQRVLVGD